MHKLVSEYKNSFLEYRHNTSRQAKLSTVLIDKPEDPNLLNANQIVLAWENLARNALSGPRRESTLVCWDGHYEQFGRLMYGIYEIADGNHKRSAELPEAFPIKNNLTFILCGPSGTEDDTFYRLWFKMLGHPDFSTPIISGIEFSIYAHWTNILTKVYLDLNSRPL